MAALKPNNRLATLINRIHKAGLPDRFTKAALTLAFNSYIKYAGTTGISIQQWQLPPQGPQAQAQPSQPQAQQSQQSQVENQSIVTLKNRMHIQNHLGGIHATAMATLAESATGMLFGLYVPDTHVPLLKSMNIQFVARAQGNLKAVATLTPEQQALIQTTDKGALIVPVKVTDQEGKEPIQCQMEWAWTMKRKKE